MRSADQRVIGRTDGEYFVKVGVVRSARVYQSTLNRYFVGRTDVFTVPAGHEALVVLQNPETSKRRTFMHVMSVTSNLGRRSIFWFDTATPVNLNVSNKVTLVHRGVTRTPETQILFAESRVIPITAGIDVFERLLEGRQTLLLDQEGKFILEPGHNHSVSLPAIDADDEIDVAFGWWEEPLATPRYLRPRKR